MNTINDLPMGVSQWQQHGEKYKYYNFFKNKMKKEIKKEIINSLKNMHNDIIKKKNSRYCDGLHAGIDLCVEKIYEIQTIKL